jgi:hypothetical protein
MVSIARPVGSTRPTGVAHHAGPHVSAPRTSLTPTRSMAGETYPYLWLDATYVKVRDGARV